MSGSLTPPIVATREDVGRNWTWCVETMGGKRFEEVDVRSLDTIALDPDDVIARIRATEIDGDGRVVVIVPKDTRPLIFTRRSINANTGERDAILCVGFAHTDGFYSDEHHLLWIHDNGDIVMTDRDLYDVEK